MPDMDGTEVLFEIRQMELAHDMVDRNRAKIIMVIARSDKNTVVMFDSGRLRRLHHQAVRP